MPDLNAERSTAKQRRDERTMLEALYAHQYDTAKKGSKPDDPGWHVCSCGWEGYWCNWQPHLADVLNAIVADRVESVSVERDGLLTAMRECLDRINKANEAFGLDPETDPAEILAEFEGWNAHHVGIRKTMSASIELWQDRCTEAQAERDLLAAKITAVEAERDRFGAALTTLRSYRQALPYEAHITINAALNADPGDTK